MVARGSDLPINSHFSPLVATIGTGLPPVNLPEEKIFFSYRYLAAFVEVEADPIV
jgi:hypothetical protein